MSDLVSVIIPTYNHAATIRRAVESVFFQSYAPIELIIVNDGSTDNTGYVLDSIAKDKKYSRLNLKIVTTENLGAPSARNRGFRESTGEFIIFWDADTTGDNRMIGKMVAVLQASPDVSYAYSGFKFGFKKFKSQKPIKE